jgi:restriction system protein
MTLETDAGRLAYAELKDPEAFYTRACKLYAEWKTAQADAESEAGAKTELLEDGGARSQHYV